MTVTHSVGRFTEQTPTCLWRRSRNGPGLPGLATLITNECPGSACRRIARDRCKCRTAADCPISPGRSARRPRSCGRMPGETRRPGMDKRSSSWHLPINIAGPGAAQSVRRCPDIVREFFGGDKALAQVIAAVVAHFAPAIVAVLDVGADIPGTHGARLVSLGRK